MPRADPFTHANRAHRQAPQPSAEASKDQAPLIQSITVAIILAGQACARPLCARHERGVVP